MNGGSARDLLRDLTERERYVLKKRFGIDESDSASLEQIARNFDITREKLEQIEMEALKKLGVIGERPKDT